MTRPDQRNQDQLRPVRITPDFMGNADGSVLIEWGNTRVLCTAMLEEGVPPFLTGKGTGWLTAEYAMLPASTDRRKKRESATKPDGRSTEIRRLIGRSLRAVVDMQALGENTVYLDCDVIQADGGTRTASITGSFIALALAADAWRRSGRITRPVVTDHLAAVSVGIVNGQSVLDLCYREDSCAEVDMNIVMTGAGQLVEVQGTGEKATFSRAQLGELLDLGEKGIAELIALQKEALKGKSYLEVEVDD
ncbi:MAG: ribonuclease PH [Eubacteriales bacterium]|nr:ribonuclease PH [Eubacteriales bacterium]